MALDLNLFSAAARKSKDRLFDIFNDPRLTLTVGKIPDRQVMPAKSKYGIRGGRTYAGTSATGHAIGTLAFLAPILLPFLIKQGINAIKKINKSKTKKDDEKLSEELIKTADNSKISKTSQSILDRVIGTGISIL